MIILVEELIQKKCSLHCAKVLVIKEEVDEGLYEAEQAKQTACRFLGKHKSTDEESTCEQYTENEFSVPDIVYDENTIKKEPI